MRLRADQTNTQTDEHFELSHIMDIALQEYLFSSSFFFSSFFSVVRKLRWRVDQTNTQHFELSHVMDIAL